MSLIRALPEYRNIPGYPKYSITDGGSVRRGDRIIAQNLTRKGYLSVCLYKNGKRTWHSVHRLVMLAFVGPSKLTVNHKNGIKTDNRIENLEYLSNRDNMRHAYKTGIRTNPKGAKHAMAKLSEEQVHFIRMRYDLSGTYMAERFGVSRSLISHIRTGRLWKNQ